MPNLYLPKVLISTSFVLGLFCLPLTNCSGGPKIEPIKEPQAKTEHILFQKDEQVIFDYLNLNKQKYGLVSPEQQLQLIDENEDAYGLRHYKFLQVKQSVPVWKNYVIVHIRNDAVFRVDGKAVLLTDKLLLKPKLSPAEAKLKAEAVLKGDMKTQLVILSEEGETARLVYEIEILEGLNRKFVFVNAMNGETEKVLEGSPSLGL